MRKPKTQQKKTVNDVSERDLFQTPNYATDLLVPFLEDIIPMSPFKPFRIWECAAGLGKIVRRLDYHGFNVYGSDLNSEDYPVHNFLTQSNGQDFDCIVTNTPFSLKKEFYLQCMRYQKPFALLIPADYSGWIIQALEDGAEKIIPTRRIDFITPNTLKRIHEGEVWELYTYKNDWKLDDFKVANRLLWNQMMNEHDDCHNYNSIYDAPAKLLRKYSSCYYHSMWLTWGFNLGKSETFVELTNDMKDNI